VSARFSSSSESQPSLALSEVARFCESRSGDRHMPRTSVRRNSGRRAGSPERRQAGPGRISVVPSGLWGVCCLLTMDLRPWLLHVMPSAFNSATSKLALRVQMTVDIRCPCDSVTPGLPVLWTCVEFWACVALASPVCDSSTLTRSLALTQLSATCPSHHSVAILRAP